MAMFGDQMQPNAGPAMGQRPQNPEEFKGLHSRWMDFLTRPETTAGLLQFAASVVQPVGRGQSVAGNIGSAVADAGGAVGRVEAARANEDQRMTENAQRDRQISTGERAQVESARANQAQEGQAGATLAFQADQSGKQLSLEERKLNEYLIPMAQKYGTGAGKLNARDKLEATLYSSALKSQQDAELLGEDFNVDDYISKGMAIIDKMTANSPTGGSTVPGGAEVGISGTGTPAAEMAIVTTPEQYSAVPPGAQYKDPQGNVRTKPTTAALP